MARRKEELELSLIDNVTRGMAAIEKGVTGLGASILKINAAAELAAKGINLIGTAVSAVTGAVGGTADLELQLKRIAELSQASAEEQRAYYEAVTTAGDRFLTTASEAAEALRLLAEDGFRGQEAIDALNTSLAFAQANGQSAAEAVGTLGAILDQFGEPATKIASLADGISAVAREADTSAKSIQEGLQRAGTAAEQANLSIETTTALLGVLARRGIEGGRGAQSLATAIQDLSNPASTAGKALEELGIKGDDFLGVLSRLQTDANAAEKVLSALGNRPRAAIQALLDQGGPALEEYIALVLRAGGASEEAGKAIGDSFTFQLSRLSNAIDKLKNDALTPILKPLADSADALADKLSELADRPEFENFVRQVGDFAQQSADKLVELGEKFDFDQSVDAVKRFADDTVVVFDAIATSAGVLAQAIRDVSQAYDRIKAAGAAVEQDSSQLLTTLLTLTPTVTGLAAAVNRLADSQGETAESAEQLAQAQRQLGSTAAPLPAVVTALVDGYQRTQQALSGVQLELVKVTPTVKDYQRAIAEAAAAGDDIGVAQLSAQLAKLQGTTKQATSEVDKLVPALNALAEAHVKAIAAGDPAKIEETLKAYNELNAKLEETKKRVAEQAEANKSAAESSAVLGQAVGSAADGIRETGSAAGEAAGQMQALAGAMTPARGAAAGLASRIQSLRQEFSFSAAAAQLFEDQLTNVNRQFLGSGLSTSIGAYQNALEGAASATRKMIAAQADLADRVEAGLGVGPLKRDADTVIGTLERLISNTEDASGQFNLLSQQRLDRLRSEIRSTISELERQKSATQSLIDLTAQLQDAADRRAGNEEAISEREYQRQLARIAELEAAGDASAKAAAAEARAAAKREHEAQMREIRERGSEERRQRQETEQVNTQSRQREREADRQAREQQSTGDGQRAATGAVSQPIVVNIEYRPEIGDLGNEEGLNRLARRLQPVFDRFQRRSA